MTDRMKADATAPQQPVKPYTPTPQEVATAAAHLARRKARIKAPRLKVGERAFNGILATLHGINPQDEVEAMLASQMVATHLAAMECLKRAQLREQTFQARDMNLRHATKLSRTYAAQVEALSRYRGKGQQKVTVEHVHSGGQAIVGAVTTGGEGAVSKPEERSHAQAVADASEFPMPCPDATRDAVPAAGGDGTEAMPDARRG